MKNNPYLETELKYFLHTFKRQPLLLKKAKGPFVWDAKGKKYYDFFSGLAVCGIGHNNPQVVKAIIKQAAQLLHTSNFFYTDAQINTAKALTARWPTSKVFFCNSGAEANELAIKLARLWATKNNKSGRDIITFDRAFHGRTLATAAASRSTMRSNDVFEPMPTGFVGAPFNDLQKTKSAITEKTIAIMLEPVQGEGGINIASKEFLQGIQKLCDDHGLLLILDEIQSGMGRTGTFFAFEQYGVKPHIVTLAKGLAGGLPLGATLAMPNVADLMVPGLHGSTFGGNPVACAAALEVLKLLSPKALKQIHAMGQSIAGKLAEFKRFPAVKEIKRFKLIHAIELNEPSDEYISLAQEKGLLINCTQGNVLRFLPPYFIKKTEVDQCLSILKSVFETRKGR
jgi:acetylornithine/N-succinyldiaminopimelate aminotransferase